MRFGRLRRRLIMKLAGQDIVAINVKIVRGTIVLDRPGIMVGCTIIGESVDGDGTAMRFGSDPDA